MTTFAITMVRNELDVIDGVIRHMADQVHAVFVLDNGSTDGTRDALATLADQLPVTVWDEPRRGYYQADRMTHLASKAAAFGADWIVPFDADEIWYAPAAGLRIRDVLAALDPDVHTVRARLFNHYRTDADLAVSDPFESMIWRWPDPGDLPKVAFRWRAGAFIEQGNHGVFLPGDQNYRDAAHALQLRHFPYRSAEQFIAKARQGADAYAAAPDLPAAMGQHWRQYGATLDVHGPAALVSHFEAHFRYPDPAAAGMLRDPAPYRPGRRQ